VPLWHQGQAPEHPEEQERDLLHRQSQVSSNQRGRTVLWLRFAGTEVIWRLLLHQVCNQLRKGLRAIRCLSNSLGRTWLADSAAAKL
jgi:hypothetical protein